MGVDNKEAPPKGLATVPPCVAPVTGVNPGAVTALGALTSRMKGQL